MAIGVIGGLIASTVLSLVFVPSFYTLMDDVAAVTSRLFRRVLTPRDAPIPQSEPAEPPGAAHPAE